MDHMVFKMPRNKSPMTFKLSWDKKMHFVKVRGYKKLSWPEEMLASYLTRNSHTLPSAIAQIELLSRLQPGGYLHTTFGPGGQNKLVCDFLKLFEFDGDLASRVVFKAGDLLRWNVDGTVYAGNDWPIHMRDPLEPNVVTLTTTDGWAGLTLFYCYANNLAGVLPSFAECVNLTRFYCYNNSLVGALPSFNACVLMVQFHCYNNNFAGALPSFAGCVSLAQFRCYSNGFVGALPSFAGCVNLTHLSCNSCSFSGVVPPFAACINLASFYSGINNFTTYNNEAMQISRVIHLINGNNLDQASVDNYLIDYEAIKTPMALSGDNYSIALYNNVPPSAIGIAARDAIIAEFAGTPGSGVLIITHD